MMKIEVRLFATLRYGRAARQTLELPEGTRLADVLARLGIDPHEVALRWVNGRDTDLESVLAENDTVALFPGVGGG